MESDGPTPPLKGLLQADDVYPLDLAEIDCFLPTVKNETFDVYKKEGRKKEMGKLKRKEGNISFHGCNNKPIRYILHIYILAFYHC